MRDYAVLFGSSWLGMATEEGDDVILLEQSCRIGQGSDVTK